MNKVVYYSAPYCMSCRMFQPSVESLCKERGIEFEKVDLEANPERKGDLTSVPVVEYTKDGGTKRLFGATGKSDLLKFFE